MIPGKKKKLSEAEKDRAGRYGPGHILKFILFNIIFKFIFYIFMFIIFYMILCA